LGADLVLYVVRERRQVTEKVVDGENKKLYDKISNVLLRLDKKKKQKKSYTRCAGHVHHTSVRYRVRWALRIHSLR